ncbi:MAG: glucose-6-phosphate dehydrogenase [Anaerolineae bacterium]|nr:glucose-6-phosphate dehydrogenase [Anaerolineae bacterium]
MSQPDAPLPTTLVIFGASGDLTERKLIPALFSLHQRGRLPGRLQIVGSARSPFSDEDFRAHLRDGVQQYATESFNAAAWDRFAAAISYLRGDSNVADDYAKLAAFLREKENGPANRLYYLAVAPSLYAPIVEHLGAADMVHETDGWRRIVVEKPFGRDLASAHALNDTIHRVFAEHQVYRIDHYLGKETAQNVLFFRFANTIFEPVWNRNYVDHVQITVAETVDVGHRASYYDHAGVLRDMFQNHLLQLLALVAMEPPASFNADALRNEKVKVLRALRPVEPGNLTLAQYEGYRDLKGVAPGSSTPTFAALKLYVDNWRWQGVPFYLRSGKALARKVSEIVVEFKCPPHVMFDRPTGDCFPPNVLSLCIQPDEGIHLQFQAKVPSSQQDTRSVDMEFHYRSSFGNGKLPDAYERLLLDALLGDASLFTRSDEIESAWRLIDPILDGREGTEALIVAPYAPGSMGPVESDDFLARDGRLWRQGCDD